MILAVIGSGNASPEEVELAEAVGREIAEHTAVLVCGGLGGVMEAACRGARQEGGLTVGILPGTCAQDANPWVVIPIATGVGEACNVIVVTAADAVIAIGGGFGTLSEIGHALKLKRPVVGLHTWDLCKEMSACEEVAMATSPREAVALAVALAGEPARSGA
jgi:uncharacterized protein (TIGR00725 family)